MSDLFDWGKPDRPTLDAYAKARELLGDNAYVYTVDGVEGHTWRKWYQVGVRYKGRDALLGCGRTWEQALSEAKKAMLKPKSAGRRLRNGENG